MAPLFSFSGRSASQGPKSKRAATYRAITKQTSPLVVSEPAEQEPIFASEASLDEQLS